MIINASGGNADAVLTVAQTLSDTQKEQARTNIGALSSASGAVGATNLASNAVQTAKIADKNVTRAKLANDALITPIVDVSESYSINTSDIGKMLRFSDDSTDYTLSIYRNTTIPIGATYAIFRYAAKSNKIVCADTVRITLAGESTYYTGATFTIPESFGQIAIMKFASTGGYDYWHVTGNVEVV